MGADDASGPLVPDGGNVFYTEYQNEPPVQAIARGLSTIEECRVDDIPSLYHHVDSDSMNRMMETARDSNQDVTVQLTVDDYTVAVDSDGTISIHDSDLDSAGSD
ncbi:hypothetical protein GS429_07075 [Natronorubrum sp. JWXQ-INN-674]|uniref:Halobacterial output domain-containing protein n=1 Tax=Natronorubrum halalkaliphilum TaxID=2691917 RepID=A0A6B0VJ01_9EURY|nr:HalOD1 output domain-containing protein [Natronorubrum halalkaliphilum]MXV61831.1 hypothetical protein [Natronorubrum halalkaliphilum]